MEKKPKLIHQGNVRQLVHDFGLDMQESAYDKLEQKVKTDLETAKERCLANKRKTLLKQDL